MNAVKYSAEYKSTVDYSRNKGELFVTVQYRRLQLNTVQYNGVWLEKYSTEQYSWKLGIINSAVDDSTLQ